jgi:hypothetical protein
MTNFIKAKSNGSFPTGQEIAEDPLEKVHITFLKWILNVNKYTSNNAVWGDTGRYPLAIELSSRVFGYLERLENLSNGNTASFSPTCIRGAEGFKPHMVQSNSHNEV